MPEHKNPIHRKKNQSLKKEMEEMRKSPMSLEQFTEQLKRVKETAHSPKGK